MGVVVPCFVLVVEDDPEIRQLIVEYCRLFGATVFEAQNGEEGERIFRENSSILLVLTDEQMPRATGREMLTHILPELQRRGGRAALVTSLVTAEVRLDCYGMGVQLVEKTAMIEPLRQLLTSEMALREGTT